MDTRVHNEDDTQISTFKWPEEKTPLDDFPGTVIREFPLYGAARITIIVPGRDSSGKKQKYEPIISKLLSNGSAVISTNNFSSQHWDYPTGIVEQVRSLVKYSISQSQRLVDDTPRPRITLYGSSAGGGAVTLVASQYKEIDSLILTGPSYDVFASMQAHNKLDFQGKTFLVRTEEDPICNTVVASHYQQLLFRSQFHTTILPGDDHAFDLPQNLKSLVNFVGDAMGDLRNREG